MDHSESAAGTKLDQSTSFTLLPIFYVGSRVYETYRHYYGETFTRTFEALRLLIFFNQFNKNYL